MDEHEFDVDASIHDGWARFRDRLAELVRDMQPGDTFDIAIPLLDASTARAPYVRFTSAADGAVVAELAGDDALDPGRGPTAAQRSQLARLGWSVPGDGGDLVVTVPAGGARGLADRVAEALETVYAVPHPAFLDDADPTSVAPSAGPAVGETPPDDPDFRAVYISTPDEATRAIGTALAQVYSRNMPADEHDVFAVPAGSALVFVRAHRSLPLVVFRCPLVSAVSDPAAAEREVAILNRDSLWCRYVFDGETVFAESELVDRVFVPVNFKIRLAEMCREIDDVDDDLARRAGGKRWLDLRTSEENGRAGK